MNATRGELSKLQEAIALGRTDALVQLRAAIAEREAAEKGQEPTPPSDGELYWHPNIKRLALRVYHSGRGIWGLQYRNKRGLTRRYTIGDAGNLNLTSIEKDARQVLADIDRGKDPQGERKELRTRPKFTLRTLCNRFLDEKTAELKNGSQEYSPRTLYSYRSLARLHLAGLAQMQADEVIDRDIGLRVKEIDAGGKHVVTGHQFRTMLGSVYDWAIDSHVLDLTANPVKSAWRRKTRAKSSKHWLTIEELGAVWRACEKLATVPARFKAHRYGAKIPIPANSIRSDDALLTLREAAHQSGLGTKLLWKAISTGALKATHGLSQEKQAFYRISPGLARRVHLVTAGDLQRFVETRRPLMRSRHFEASVIMRLLMLFGCRYMEIAGLRWSELDLDKKVLHIKTVTAEGHRRIKSRRGQDKDLTIYLPQLAVDIIKTVTPVPGRDHLFGTDRTGLTSTGISTGLLNSGVNKKELDQTIAAIEGAPIRKWRIHDLRHSLTTHLNEMGVDPRIVESITNHSGVQVSGMMSRYNHATYELTVRKVLDVWAKTLRNAADRVQIDTSNVTQLFVGGNGK
jgi:integrase